MNPVSQGAEIIMVRPMRTIAPCTLLDCNIGQDEDHVSARLYFGIETAYIDVVSVTQQRKVQYARLSGSSMARNVGNRIWRPYLACTALSGEVGEVTSAILGSTCSIPQVDSLMELSRNQADFSIGE